MLFDRLIMKSIHNQTKKTIRESLLSGVEILTPYSTTPRIDAEILLSEIIGKNREYLAINPLEILSNSQINSFNKLINRRKEKEPISYILEKKAFYKHEFEVNPNVLIPRPETELIVENAVNHIINNPGIKTFADIGTGSGCIIISVILELEERKFDTNNIKWFATDISPDAIKVAKRNAEKLLIDTEINWKTGNLFEGIECKIDVITANLPYVPENIKKSLEKDVINYEPHVALFGGKEGHEIFATFIKQMKSYVSDHSWAILEIHPKNSSIISRYIQTEFPKERITVIKDLSGKDRFLEIES